MVWLAVVCAYSEVARVLCFCDFLKNYNKNLKIKTKTFHKDSKNLKNKPETPKNQNKVKLMWVTHKKRAGVWGILRGIRGVPRNKPPYPPYRKKQSGI
ncbi:hypothetical protein BBW65_01710 [Helicobacter enhydrae]|uniref:Uncharacterized protein n=1 Tax=Helicobacter enhydrae TaxID=222136 RepID=A0A1B1U4B2_9HELI|nr:hypothetical protein BBW65_01710 [Helicobacter enhydrae]